MTKELSIEQYLATLVADRGGVYVKLDPAGFKGIPDRLIVLPGGYSAFAEIKKPKGGVVSPHQKMWRIKLTSMGAAVFTIYTREDAEALVDSYDAVIEGRRLPIA